ncbi:MAG: hypothetical protein WA655_00055 [Candidatus Korobacteraceae bacterium]
MTRVRFSLVVTTALLLAMPVSADDTKSQTNTKPQTSTSSEKMTPQTRLVVMRDLTAERVFVRVPFPRGERGLEIKNGVVTPNAQQVAQLMTEHGLAAKAGDRVVITNVVVKEKSIVLDINGGAKKHEKWYQHVSVGAGGGTAPIGGAPKSLEATGSVVTLEFDKYVPELTGEQVRKLLDPVFDFKALTEAEAYEKTLPPKVQEAIKNHKVLVGMDRDMVIYSKGRPPNKVRDRDDKGSEYEEWIYGTPPQEVQFVRFQGGLVTRLEIMTVDGDKVVRTEKEVDLKSAETEVADKKPEQKPANAPTLRRPGEQVEYPQGTQNTPSTPYPGPGTTTPTEPPGSSPPGPPPQWKAAGVL